MCTSSRGPTDTESDQEQDKRMRENKISPCATIKRSNVQEVALGES